MSPDLWELYQQMLRSRLFEEAVIELWAEGLIFGEMHVGIGEEAIAAGVISHLEEGDALALDHRASPQVIMRGLDPILVLKELLGRPDGLSGGRGGHMHLLSEEYLLAASGIVGSSGPAAAGFALAAQYNETKGVAVAFFGEGAINQGMLMESLNLAVVWKLPVIFVCKDNGWAITTRSEQSMGAEIAGKARSFGMPAVKIDGRDVVNVWAAADRYIGHAREGNGPAFIHATCSRPDSHLLGDLLMRTARREQIPDVGPVMRSAAGKGDSLKGRVKNMNWLMGMFRQALHDHRFDKDDPLELIRPRLMNDEKRLLDLERMIQEEMAVVVRKALG